MQEKDIEKILYEKLGKKRFRHTIGVRYTAICLAMRYGSDLSQASLAGLLHDCAKRLNNAELLQKCADNELPVTDAERRNPFLLHAKVGAWMAAQDYGVDDQEILGAITWHTTGRPDMTMLEKIIFTADYIEPYRDQAPNLDKLRQTAFIDLDHAVYLILQQTLDYLGQDGKDIDPMTERTRDYYRQIIEAVEHE